MGQLKASAWEQETASTAFKAKPQFVFIDRLHDAFQSLIHLKPLQDCPLCLHCDRRQTTSAIFPVSCALLTSPGLQQSDWHAEGVSEGHCSFIHKDGIDPRVLGGGTFGRPFSLTFKLSLGISKRKDKVVFSLSLHWRRPIATKSEAPRSPIASDPVKLALLNNPRQNLNQ